MLPPTTATAPDELELLTAITATTRQRLGAAACSVAWVDGDELVFVAADGMGADAVVGLRISLGRGIAGWVAVSGQSIAVADVHRDQRFDRQSAEATGYLPTSILATPVEDDEGPIGVLEVLDRTPGPHDLEWAGEAARQLALTRQLAGGRAALDAELGNPELAELLDLIGQVGRRGAAERGLATRLLRALLEDG